MQQNFEDHRSSRSENRRDNGAQRGAESYNFLPQVNPGGELDMSFKSENQSLEATTSIPQEENLSLPEKIVKVISSSSVQSGTGSAVITAPLSPVGALAFFVGASISALNTLGYDPLKKVVSKLKGNESTKVEPETTSLGGKLLGESKALVDHIRYGIESNAAVVYMGSTTGLYEYFHHMAIGDYLSASAYGFSAIGQFALASMLDKQSQHQPKAPKKSAIVSALTTPLKKLSNITRELFSSPVPYLSAATSLFGVSSLLGSDLFTQSQLAILCTGFTFYGAAVLRTFLPILKQREDPTSNPDGLLLCGTGTFCMGLSALFGGQFVTFTAMSLWTSCNYTAAFNEGETSLKRLLNRS